MERIGLTPGTPIGGYTIVAPLGSGGMGAVYRAVDDGGGQVALKLLHPDVGADPVARTRLVREAAALQRLHHPAVARVLDVEADSTEAFLVTELVGGQPLDTVVRRSGPLDAPALALLADRLAQALAAVHEAGVVHRDLKPSNVMMTADGPVLIDFGLAHAVGDAHVTSTGLVAGTPGYLAPELLDGAEPGPAADLWGWAALLAFAGTGRPPFGSGPVGTVLARSRGGAPDLAGLPPRTAAALRGALAVEPADRLPPTDVVEALAADARGDAYVDEEPTADEEPTQVVVDHDAETLALAAALRPAQVGGLAGPANDGRTRVLEVGGGVETDGSSAEMDAAAPVGPPDTSPDDAVLAPLAGDDEELPDGALDLSDDEAGYRRPPTTRRWGTMLALLLLVGAAGAQAPVLTLAVVAAAMLVWRTVGSVTEAMHTRRERDGVRGSDLLRAAVSTPWHLVLALLGVLPAVLVGASVVVIVLGVAWWLVGSGRWHLTDAVPGDVPTGLGVQLVVGAVVLVGAAVAWFGPLGRVTRIGARRALAVVARPPVASVVLVVAALAATAALVTRVAAGDPMTWWPAPAPRLLAP